MSQVFAGYQAADAGEADVVMRLVVCKSTKTEECVFFRYAWFSRCCVWF